MEEEVELVGPREDFLSEDDHSPTDASEDSVEVKVTPIKTHYRPLTLPTQPLPHKVAAAAHQRSHSPPTHKFHHKFRKHYATVAIKQEYEQKARITSPQDYVTERQSLSPQDFSRSRESPHYDIEIKHSPQDFSIVRHSPGVSTSPIPAHVRPSTPTSPVEAPIGAAPLSPGTRAAAARSRRKPAEPRRLCHDGAAIKRSHSPEPPHKSAKVPRTDSVIIHDDKSVASSPSPGAPPLLAHHPLLGPLARPPMGAFPPLLLPPAWPPVAAQWGYPRVVTPLGWAGLTPGLTPHHYPMLLPHPYPLARPLLHPHMHPASPPPKSPPPRPPSEEHVRDDLPIPLVTRVPPPHEPPTASSTYSSTTHQHPHHPHHPHTHHHQHHHQHHPAASREVSVVKKVGKAPSKFLSVESLIASDKPTSSRETTASVTTVVPQEVEEDIPASLQGDDDETIHSLMQPNKQKQRNYKNMTRERRIEANARERNRVHTISAAFEKLRTSVPAYSHNQKLSKLSVLRIACSYILLLSRLAGHDYSDGGSEPSFSECVDLTTRTIQVEGKAKKKRDE